jgi:hypothetical protein
MKKLLKPKRMKNMSYMIHVRIFRDEYTSMMDSLDCLVTEDVRYGARIDDFMLDLFEIGTVDVLRSYLNNNPL